MPITITKTVRTFGEMIDQFGADHRAVNKARQWMQEAATDYQWWEFVNETWTTALEQIGFVKPKFSFSGFWSQGDGASFTCKHVDCETLLRFMAAEMKANDCVDVIDGQEDYRPWLLHELGWSNQKFNHRLDWLAEIARNHLNGEVVRTSHHYSHENTCRFRCELQGSYRNHAALNEVVNDFEKDVESLRIGLCQAFYRQLKEEYEYRTADEQLRENSEANEWMFDENGNRDG